MPLRVPRSACVEGVGAAQSGRSRLSCVPGAEVAAALDLAHRLGIGQLSGEIHRLAGAYGAQLQALDDKLLRELARLVCAQREHGVGAVHLADKDAYLAAFSLAAVQLG